jgi:hypothetical protein
VRGKILRSIKEPGTITEQLSRRFHGATKTSPGWVRCSRRQRHRQEATDALSRKGASLTISPAVVGPRHMRGSTSASVVSPAPVVSIKVV